MGGLPEDRPKKGGGRLKWREKRATTESDGKKTNVAVQRSDE